MAFLQSLGVSFLVCSPVLLHTSLACFGALLLGVVTHRSSYSLENLAAMEETVVRDKAVESACIVIGLMQGGQQEVRVLIVTNQL